MRRIRAIAMTIGLLALPWGGQALGAVLQAPPPPPAPPLMLVPQIHPYVPPPPVVLKSPSFTPNAPPPPVAMFPPPGEPNRQVSGSVQPDPDYEAVVQGALAERDRRAAQAKSEEKRAADMQAGNRAATDKAARTGNPYMSPFIARTAGYADQIAAHARELMPKTAPPLSDAEKQANQQRLAQMAPSGRDGYCQELAHPSSGAVAAGVVCACGVQYRNILLARLKGFEDEAGKLMANPRLAAQAAQDAARKNTGTSYGPARLLDSMRVMRQSNDLTRKSTDFTQMCNGVFYRESDPRRRLLVPDVAHGYEPGGAADVNAKRQVFHDLARLVYNVASQTLTLAAVRHQLAAQLDGNDPHYDNPADTAVIAAQTARIQAAYNALAATRKNYAHDADFLNAANGPGLAIGRQAEQAFTAVCNSQLAGLSALIKRTDNDLAQQLASYLADRKGITDLLGADVPVWEALANRNGFSNDPSTEDIAHSYDAFLRLKPDISDVNYGVQIGFRLGVPYAPYSLWSSDRHGVFHHEICESQYGQMIAVLRDTAQNGQANYDFGSAGLPPAFVAPAELPDMPIPRFVKVRAWVDLAAEPKKPVQEAAALHSAQGGRYPEDGP